MARRLWMRLVLVGAAGLFPLIGRASAEAAKAGEGILAKWARLGHVWRLMSGHWRKRCGERRTAEYAFVQLKGEMNRALDDLPASPELRALFLERWDHIHRSLYDLSFCYAMGADGIAVRDGRDNVEQRVGELEALWEQGRITREALHKAAAAIAVSGELLVRERKLWQEIDRLLHGGGPSDELPAKLNEGEKELPERYRSGKLKPSAATKLAAQRLVELTVDRLGVLADLRP
jgi:hypothetical protein